MYPVTITIQVGKLKPIVFTGETLEPAYTRKAMSGLVGSVLVKHGMKVRKTK